MPVCVRARYVRNASMPPFKLYPPPGKKSRPPSPHPHPHPLTNNTLGRLHLHPDPASVTAVWDPETSPAPQESQPLWWGSPSDC